MIIDLLVRTSLPRSMLRLHSSAKCLRRPYICRKILARGFAARFDHGGLNASAVSQLTDAYRRFGHFEVPLDPLQLRSRPFRSELQLERYFNVEDSEAQRLAASLRRAYCTVGVEFEHLESELQRDWWAAQLEALNGSSAGLALGERRTAASLMLQAATFETFVEKR
jgi:2-oxoglutarate dehydrogenase complex dehydrogenase (E1) component-like enzyme